MRILRVLARVVSAVVLLAAAVGAIILAEQYPPAAPATVTGEATAVSAGPLSLVCAGPLELTTGEQIAIDPETDADPDLLVPASRTEVFTLARDGNGSSDAAEAEYQLEGDTPEGLTVMGDLRAAQIDDPESGGILEAQAVGGAAALAAGASVTMTEAGDLRGLAGTSCQRPASATYLVGGSGDVGSSTRLTLTNTGTTSATASVTLWSSLGEVPAPQLDEISLAPGESEHLLLEAISSDPDLAVRVESPGGQVSAYAQELRLDGIVPAGADLFGPAAPPAPDFLIPGVLLTSAAEDGADPDEAEEEEAEEGEADELAPETPARLRLVNPGESEARATVQLLGESGPVDLPGAENVTIDPGAVLELSLAVVDPGAYAVHVVADEPLTGAVQLARTGTPGPLDPSTAPVDRAWAPAVSPAAAALIPLPALADATVLMSNNGAEAADVTLAAIEGDGSMGAPETVEIDPWSTRVIDAEGHALLVQTDGAVSAAAVLRADAADGELITVATPVPDAAEDLAVRVTVR
ncbi:DUF5719 family protein [Bogoriella caseilytica]|uniref:Uncharacterized protein n=1 Tax=Bogoriella caseilytica TaxID=56055 RepID=A0A3N2BA23_9MICO|nr:DUF5719 family protein [Bogoriella caseilytica]ROR72105.1 hypothetical protein EDD31_0452 [Bogoriella caseilytica]